MREGVNQGGCHPGPDPVGEGGLPLVQAYPYFVNAHAAPEGTRPPVKQPGPVYPAPVPAGAAGRGRASKAQGNGIHAGRYVDHSPASHVVAPHVCPMRVKRGPRPPTTRTLTANP